MFCSECNSGEIQKVSLVYESGITHSTSRTAGTGIGFGAGGIGFGIGGAKTKGIHVNATAQRVAPPSKASILWPVIVLIVAVWLSLVIFSSAGSQAAGVGWFFLVVFGGISGFIIYRRVTWNRNVFPSLADQWSRSYLCNRCGSMMIPIVAQSTPVSSQSPPAVGTTEQSSALPS